MIIFVLTIITVGVIFFFIYQQNETVMPNNSTSSRVISYDLTNYTHYEEYEVAGISFDGRKEAFRRFCGLKYPIRFEHEKSNKFSDKAVAIYCDNVHIGYIEDHLSQEVLELMKNDYTALVSNISDSAGWLDVTVKVYFKLDDEEE